MGQRVSKSRSEDFWMLDIEKPRRNHGRGFDQSRSRLIRLGLGVPPTLESGYVVNHDPIRVERGHLHIVSLSLAGEDENRNVGRLVGAHHRGGDGQVYVNLGSVRLNPGGG